MPSFSPLPSASRDLTISGLSIGHGTDSEGKTGVTVILCPDGVTAAAEVRGTATSTRQFDSLTRSHHIGSRVHAVVLAGGSGFGLSCTDGVVEELAGRGVGFPTGYRPLPLVPTAILFDLGFGDSSAQPTPELARRACRLASTGSVECGSIGVGVGATVGKALGVERGMKGGFGFASLQSGVGPTVAAAVAVNAFGDVRDPETGRIIAGCRTEPDSTELAHADRVLASPQSGALHPWEGNTTLAVVMTDASLDKTGCRKVCEMAFGGFYRTLVPALSLYDGDLVITLACGELTAHPHQVGVLAERAVTEAILTAVRDAEGFGLLPAVDDLRQAHEHAPPPGELG
jgi:L-aminopeptidase/D-esterase-like protein